MIPASIGNSVEVVIFVVGMWAGWRLTRPSSGDVIVGWRELWRHGPDPAKYRRNPKRLRVGVAASAGCLVAFGAAVLGDYLGSKPISVLSLAGVAFCIGLGWGAVWFGGVLKSG
jgi:hypothetical protein